MNVTNSPIQNLGFQAQAVVAAAAAAGAGGGGTPNLIQNLQANANSPFGSPLTIQQRIQLQQFQQQQQQQQQLLHHQQQQQQQQHQQQQANQGHMQDPSQG